MTDNDEYEWLRLALSIVPFLWLLISVAVAFTPSAPIAAKVMIFIPSPVAAYALWGMWRKDR